VEHLAFDWHKIITGIGVRQHSRYILLDSGSFEGLLEPFHQKHEDPFARLDTYLLYGAAAILGRNKMHTEQALAYQAKLNEKTKAISLFFWAQEAAAQLQHRTAIGLLKPLTTLFPHDPELNSLMAVCYQQIQDLHSGWAFIKEGLRHTPHHAGLNASLCQYHMAEGNLTETEATARYLLTLDANNVTAFNLLSRTKPDRIDATLLAHFTRLAESGACGPVNSAGLMFDLGRIYDSRHDYTRAFNAIETANRLMQNVPQSAKTGFDEKAEFAQYEMRRDLLNQLPQQEINAAIKPVFIVGLPRTGSTLLDQALASHPDVASLGETPFIPNIALEAETLIAAGQIAEASARMKTWRDSYLAQATSANPGAGFIIDKTLGNSRHIGFLKKLFPNAKFLHVRRDFMDTGLSIYFAPLLRTNTYATDLAAIAGFIALDESIIKSWASLGYGALDVHYEDMVNAFEKTMRQVCTYIGLGWHNDCLNFHEKKRIVHTYSAHQVRRGIYKSSKGRWQNYANQLAPFQAALRKKGIAA